MFALMIFHCDSFLKVADGVEETHKVARFFRVCEQLPIELQMVLANRLHGIGGDLIACELRERAFREVVLLS